MSSSPSDRRPGSFFPGSSYRTGTWCCYLLAEKQADSPPSTGKWLEAVDLVDQQLLGDNSKQKIGNEFTFLPLLMGIPLTPSIPAEFIRKE